MIDDLTKLPILNHSYYNVIRRDRNNNGGGILVFIRKEYKLVRTLTSSDYELLSFQLTINDTNINFIISYKPPNINDLLFIDFIESFLLNFDLNEPIFIFGDLNLDLLSNKGDTLRSFMNDYNFSNSVSEPTRIAFFKHRISKEVIMSSTLIDVCLSNNILPCSSKVIGCPFSDHKFVTTTINTPSIKSEASSVLGRNLNEINTRLILEEINKMNLRELNEIVDTDLRWINIKNKLLSIIDAIAPIKKINTATNKNRFPWIDNELTDFKKKRDYAYSLASKSKLANDWFNYKKLRNMFQKQSRAKLIEFFSRKKSNDFNDSKKFWKFYKNHVKTKSDTGDNNIDSIIHQDKIITNDDELCEVFNMFFTSIAPASKLSQDDCHRFIYHHFRDMKNQFIKNVSEFSFREVNEKAVLDSLNELSASSSPGASNIPTKIILLAKDKLIPLLTILFNDIIISSCIPTEWKSAVVTPLYKSKGVKHDLNNYRGISVIPPIAKLFEKIISKQITAHFENSNLFFDGQHGFRSGHSCETALHEIISSLNENQNKRLVNLLLFIDFRKAFDTVDAELLLLKLFHYGFSNSALKLVQNYFIDRYQITKLKSSRSKQQKLQLGVPQGSILGPVFFLIFINDLAYFITQIIIKLFADDTTFIIADVSIDNCLTKFKHAVLLLVDWCEHNRLDINWSKTYAMLNCKNDTSTVTEIQISDAIVIKVVDKFKLLGVTIDNKLNFLSYVADISLKINRKIHCIKRLFFLATSVKLQFFKSFILPYFDYCLTLSIYYSKEALQKLSNLYYNYLFKLFKFQLNNMEAVSINNFLKRFNLFSFQHRIFYRISMFSINSKKLISKLEQNTNRNIPYMLRNKDHLTVTQTNLKEGKKTLQYFFSKFLNTFYINHLNLKFSIFKNFVLSNLDLFFEHFVSIFPNFQLRVNIFIVNLINSK